MDLRRQTQRETIARLLLLGMTAERVARKMGVTARAIRYHVSTPEFEVLYAKLQGEYLQRIDRKLGSLLNGAVDTLEKLLKHSDWRARDAAIQHIFKIHGRYIDKIDVTGNLDHSGRIHHVQAELVDETPWTDEMRDKARELLRLQREMLQRQLPAKFVSSHNSHNDPVNGRFTRTHDQSDEERA